MSEQRVPQSISVACARCHEPAAVITIFPGSQDGRGIAGDRIERSGFLCHVTAAGAWERLLEIIDLFRRGHFTALVTWDGDFVGFWCRACQKAYCQSCWCIRAPMFDGGLYDCTRGTCPADHEQVIDD